jgi:hypothetical protein
VRESLLNLREITKKRMAPMRQSASTNQLRGRLDINSSKKSVHIMLGSGGLPISHQSPYAEPAQRDDGPA